MRKITFSKNTKISQRSCHRFLYFSVVFFMTLTAIQDAVAGKVIGAEKISKKHRTKQNVSTAVATRTVSREKTTVRSTRYTKNSKILWEDKGRKKIKYKEASSGVTPQIVRVDFVADANDKSLVVEPLKQELSRSDRALSRKKTRSEIVNRYQSRDKKQCVKKKCRQEKNGIKVDYGVDEILVAGPYDNVDNKKTTVSEKSKSARLRSPTSLSAEYKNFQEHAASELDQDL